MPTRRPRQERPETVAEVAKQTGKNAANTGTAGAAAALAATFLPETWGPDRIMYTVILLTAGFGAAGSLTRALWPAISARLTKLIMGSLVSLALLGCAADGVIRGGENWEVRGTVAVLDSYVLDCAEGKADSEGNCISAEREVRGEDDGTNLVQATIQGLAEAAQTVLRFLTPAGLSEQESG